MMDALVFDEAKSTAAASNGLIRQLEFLPELQARLKENPDSIVKDLEEFRSIITQPNGMRVSVAGNILELEKPRSAWAEHFKTVAVRFKLSTRSSDRFSDAFDSSVRSDVARVVGSGCSHRRRPGAFEEGPRHLPTLAVHLTDD